ncbi:hypothetical protein BS47DRAFT_1308822, partial [Hydnum rufescens UP504]
LWVLCISMEQLEEVVLTVCPCHLAAIQLVERGFFPCAPLSPHWQSVSTCLNLWPPYFFIWHPMKSMGRDSGEYLKACGYEFATRDSFQLMLCECTCALSGACSVGQGRDYLNCAG